MHDHRPANKMIHHEIQATADPQLRIRELPSGDWTSWMSRQ
jgi:hypothetical protein